MQRSHKTRLYPTKEQETMLYKTAGVRRFVRNWSLAEWKSMQEACEKGESTEKPTANKLSTRWTQVKKTEFPWANEVCACVQQRAIKDTEAAFKRMWKGLGKYPKFQKKGYNESFYVNNQQGHMKGRKLHIDRIGDIRIAEHLRYTGKIMSYTVSLEAGQWFASVQVETNKDERPQCANPTSKVGIDVGLKHIATASDGTILDAPKSLERLTKRLKWEQRRLSKKQKRSHNYQKQLLRKQKIQQRINNIRKDCTHKFTTAITKNHGIVKVETLGIKDMMEKAAKHLRSSLATSMMGEVLRQLAYKAQNIVKAHRFFPSSKKCSHCGHVKFTLGLDERTYVCEECGFTLDRDLNAAINLMNYSGAVSPIEPVDSSGTRGAEAGSTTPVLG